MVAKNGFVAALAFVALLGSSGAASQAAAADDVLLREEFTSLDAWRPLYFPKVQRHTRYSIEADASGGETWLRAESDNSSSALIWRRQYDLYAYPRLRWRWRVENVYRAGDPTKKSGDDYPIRIYVVFPFDPGAAPLAKRLKYGLVKAVYGEYPPEGGLNYVWESGTYPAEYVVSPVVGSIMMIFKEKGAAKVGQWVEEEVDVLADYRRAFGKDPPHTAGLAVMNDSDNTGEQAVSFIDWIEIAR
jgi:hypothetical protein